MIPKPLSPLSIKVLVSGAKSSGPAGLNWRLNYSGEPCSRQVRGLLDRGFVETVPSGGVKITATTQLGREALEKAPL